MDAGGELDGQAVLHGLEELADQTKADVYLIGANGLLDVGGVDLDVFRFDAFGFKEALLHGYVQGSLAEGGRVSDAQVIQTAVTGAAVGGRSSGRVAALVSAGGQGKDQGGQQEEGEDAEDTFFLVHGESLLFPGYGGVEGDQAMVLWDTGAAIQQSLSSSFWTPQAASISSRAASASTGTNRRSSREGYMVRYLPFV